MKKMSPGQYDKMLKKIEAAIVGNAFHEKILEERNNRSKSSFIWFEEEDKVDGKVKLEIGSRIKPEPYEKRKLKCYIQEYLEKQDMLDVIKDLVSQDSKNQCISFYLQFP